MKTVKNQLALRIFTGFLINPELRMHLQQSKLWKEAKLFHHLTASLVEVRFEEKDYIGRYLPLPEISIQEIKSLEDEIKKEIQALCPMLKVDKLHLRFFSQPFIS